MRSKNILSIVAFVAAFGLSAAFASQFISKNTYSYNSTSYCKYRQKTATSTAIEALITADSINARTRYSKMYDIGESYPPAPDSVAFADYAQAIKKYVDNSSSEATDNLPRDFKLAWREHLRAWRDYSNYLNKSAEISGSHSLTAEEFDDAEIFYSTEINRTFAEVLEIGSSYGADIH